jgi:hypothetical protein
VSTDWTLSSAKFGCWRGRAASPASVIMQPVEDRPPMERLVRPARDDSLACRSAGSAGAAAVRP